MNTFLALLLVSVFGLLHTLQAQTITHGPAVGALSPTGVRVYIRTDKPTVVSLSLDPPARVQNSTQNSWEDQTDPARDNSICFDIKGLKPNTDYTYKASTAGGSQKGSFRTPPMPGEAFVGSFAFGSCNQSNLGDTVFGQVLAAKPLFFMHLGDWTYPDHDNYPGYEQPKSQNYFYSSNYAKVEEAYRVRMSTPYLREMLKQVPIDFIHDDDDFAFDDNSRSTYTHDSLVGKKKYIFVEKALPAYARSNAIKGYVEHFPHYPLVDTAEGLYHSIRFGNVEIFFIDSRSARSPVSEALVRKGGRFVFAPKPEHSLLGDKQRAWLLDGLKRSTATWKFIASGTNFNPGYKGAIDVALKFQNMSVGGMTGAKFAAMMLSMWVGFPHDAHRLLEFCRTENIQNVMVLSGDSHSGAIDDGANSGFPELMAACLANHNTRIPWQLSTKLGLNIWNSGGQGLNGNTNFRNHFGRVQVYGNDSVALSIVDDRGELVARKCLKPGFVPKAFSLADMSTLSPASKRIRSKLIGNVIRYKLGSSKKKK